MSTVSDSSSLYPTTTIPHPYTVSTNTTTPVPNNTPIEPVEAFKNSVNEIIEDILYISAYISYELKTVLLQLAELRKELKVATSTY